MDKKEEIFNALMVYRDNGFYCLRKEQYKKAIDFFSKAYELNPDDKRTITGRSIAKSSFSIFDGALFDAEMILSLDEDDIKAQFLKGQALYEMGEFEDGLVNFHTGLRRRTCPNYFQIGVMEATETIEDCIGRNVGPALLDFSDTIKTLEERNRVVTKFKLPQDSAKDEACAKTLRERCAKIDKILSGKYLGRLSKDKRFLETLINSPGLISPNKKGYRELSRIVHSGADLLKQRQEVLRSRKPFYAVKYNEATFSETMRRKKELEAMRKIEATQEEAYRMLLKLKELRGRGTIKEFIEFFNLTLAFYDSKNLKTLPKKREYSDALFNLFGQKFLEEKEYQDGKSNRDNVRLIRLQLGLPPIKETTYDGILKLPPMPVIDIKKCTKSLDLRLGEIETKMERVWVYYELARLYLELGKVDLARLYAKKCVLEAKDNESVVWAINGNFIIAKCEINQRNKVDAKAVLTDACADARKLADPKTAFYLEKCLEQTEVSDLDQIEDKSIEMREKAIVKIMSDTGLRGDMEYLFRRMSVNPAARRMSLMPGIRTVDKLAPKRNISNMSAVSQDSPIVQKRSFRPSTVSN